MLNNIVLNMTIQKTAVKFPVELASVLDVSVEQLNSWLELASTTKTNLIIHKLTKAMHLNEKLSESAMGADETMHQYIDDELKNVISIIK